MVIAANNALYVVKSGLVLEDDFSSVHSRWLISPSSSMSITERVGFMRLKHANSADTLALLDKPSTDIAIQVIADYTPAVDNDEGGIVIWKNDSSKVEFLEKFDSTKTEFQKEWLAESVGSNWNFYSKEDGTFNFLDSDQLDATKVGIVVKKGSNPSFVPLDIDRVIVTAGRKIRVTSLTPGMKIVVSTNTDVVLAEGIVGDAVTGIDILLPELIVQGKLKVYDSAGVLYTELATRLYGGDEYSLGSTIQIRRNGTELSTTSPTDIGNLVGGFLQIPLSVHNPSLATMSNVKVSITQYSTKFGYTWADVAKDVSGSPSTYSDVITFTSLASGATVNIWVKVTKGNDYMGLESPKFNVHVNHD